MSARASAPARASALCELPGYFWGPACATCALALVAFVVSTVLARHDARWRRARSRGWIDGSLLASITLCFYAIFTDCFLDNGVAAAALACYATLLTVAAAGAFGLFGSTSV